MSKEGENGTPEAKFINVESRLASANELSIGKENVGSVKESGGRGGKWDIVWKGMQVNESGNNVLPKHKRMWVKNETKNGA